MSVPASIGVLLILYGLIFLAAWYDKRKLDATERKTFWVFYFFWSITVFIINYLGSLIGVFSFLPWLNNFLHTFVWIGVVLTWMFLAIRHLHFAVQFMAFALFSLVVRYSEYKLFGVWDHDHFLFAFRGTDAYILGWSFIDGFYPVGAFILLALLRKRVPGLVSRGAATTSNPAGFQASG